LDAREGLPPALRPDMLMDWESWWMFEALSVTLLANADAPIDAVLGRLAGIVERVRPWRPDDGVLSDRVRQAFADDFGPTGSTIDHEMRRREVREAIPDEWNIAPGPDLRLALRSPRATSRGEGPGLHPESLILRHFLAAHAFANWTAHLGQGLRTWLRSVE